MKIDFIKVLASCRVEGTQLPFFPEKIKGYTEEEINLIAHNCNLYIHGQFREFLLQMGKCSGGLLWGWEFPMYNPYWNPLDFQLFQQNEREDKNYMTSLGALDPIKNKIFYLDSENEGTYFYYLLTINHDDCIWGYYESKNRLFEKTEITLLERLKHIVQEQTRNYQNINFTLTNEQISKYTEGRLL